MLLLIYVAFFVLLYRKIDSKMRITRFIVLYYLISSIFSVYLMTLTDLYKDVTISFESIIYFCGIYLFFIKGLVAIEKSFIPLNRYRLNEKVIVLFSYFLILISIISFIYSISVINKMQIFSLEDINMHRNEFVEKSAASEGANLGFLGYITGPSNMLCGIKIFMFFYLITFYRREHKILSYLLFICSLSYVIENLTVVGRDAMMKWLVLLLLNYIIFSVYMNSKLKRKIKLVFITLIPIMLVPTIYITIARFSTSNETSLLKGFVSTIDPIIDYFGQGYINFSRIFDYAFNSDLYGKLTFPIFWGKEALNHFELNSMPYFRYATMPLNVFHTFIGAFYIDFGFWGTIILSAVFYIFLKTISKITSGNLPSLILLLLTTEVLLMGLFYFMHWMPMFQKIYVFTIFCCFVLKLRRDFSRNSVTKKMWKINDSKRLIQY